MLILLVWALGEKNYPWSKGNENYFDVFFFFLIQFLASLKVFFFNDLEMVGNVFGIPLLRFIASHFVLK